MARHEAAVEAAIKAAGNRLSDCDRPLIELCRVLAAQMDDAGTNPSTRLTAAYLSGLKDLRRALVTGADPATANNRLAQLRAIHAPRRT